MKSSSSRIDISDTALRVSVSVYHALYSLAVDRRGKKKLLTFPFLFSKTLIQLLFLSIFFKEKRIHLFFARFLFVFVLVRLEKEKKKWTQNNNNKKKNNYNYYRALCRPEGK